MRVPSAECRPHAQEHPSGEEMSRVCGRAAGDGGSRCDGEALMVGVECAEGFCALVSSEPALGFLVHLKLVTALRRRYYHCLHFVRDALRRRLSDVYSS